MPYVSFLSAVRSQMEAARDGGLIAAGEVYRTALKEDLRGGYTTGNFVTGETAATIQRTDPYDSPAGRAVSVFTTHKPALYWFAGHINLFTRKFERVDKWTPALNRSTPEQLAAFERVFARLLSA